jgi:hypothetical protein
MTDWNAAQRKAASTARWATTMTKVRIRKTIAKTRWQLVTFLGKRKGESVGIVDMLAIRKNHVSPTNGLKRGELFQIVLIQIKGGGAAFPSLADIERLRKVSREYRAKTVLLAHWHRGRQAEFYRLKRLAPADGKAASHWEAIDSPAVLFH